MFASKGFRDATTSRPSSSAILAIDSEDRFKDFIQARSASLASYNASPYDFQITKNESMMNGFFTRLALTEVNFPWTIPNINAQTQQIIFNYALGAGPLISATLTLPIGFYKPSDIAAALEFQIQSLDIGLATFQMAYGVDTILGGSRKVPVFFYRSPVGTGVNFEPLFYSSTAYPYPPTTKQLFDLLGFTSDNSDNLEQQGLGRSTYCQSVRYIDIVCSQLTYNQAVKDTMSQTIARDTLCRMYIGDGPYTGTSTMDPSDPLFCPPGCAPFTIYRQFTNPKFIRWNPDQPVQGNLQFQVFDDDGQILTNLTTFDGTENWSMTLLASED